MTDNNDNNNTGESGHLAMVHIPDRELDLVQVENRSTGGEPGQQIVCCSEDLKNTTGNDLNAQPLCDNANETLPLRPAGGQPLCDIANEIPQIPPLMDLAAPDGLDNTDAVACPGSVLAKTTTGTGLKGRSGRKATRSGSRRVAKAQTTAPPKRSRSRKEITGNVITKELIRARPYFPENRNQGKGTRPSEEARRTDVSTSSPLTSNACLQKMGQKTERNGHTSDQAGSSGNHNHKSKIRRFSPEPERGRKNNGFKGFGKLPKGRADYEPPSRRKKWMPDPQQEAKGKGQFPAPYMPELNKIPWLAGGHSAPYGPEAGPTQCFPEGNLSPGMQDTNMKQVKTPSPPNTQNGLMVPQSMPRQTCFPEVPEVKMMPPPPPPYPEDMEMDQTPGQGRHESPIKDAGLTRFGRTGPTDFGRAGPTDLGRAGPPKLGYAGPSDSGNVGTFLNRNPTLEQVDQYTRDCADYTEGKYQARRAKLPKGLVDHDRMQFIRDTEREFHFQNGHRVNHYLAKQNQNQGFCTPEKKERTGQIAGISEGIRKSEINNVFNNNNNHVNLGQPPTGGPGNWVSGKFSQMCNGVSNLIRTNTGGPNQSANLQNDNALFVSGNEINNRTLGMAFSRQRTPTVGTAHFPSRNTGQETGNTNGSGNSRTSAGNPGRIPDINWPTPPGLNNYGREGTCNMSGFVFGMGSTGGMPEQARTPQVLGFTGSKMCDKTPENIGNPRVPVLTGRTITGTVTEPEVISRAVKAPASLVAGAQLAQPGRFSKARQETAEKQPGSNINMALRAPQTLQQLRKGSRRNPVRPPGRPQASNDRSGTPQGRAVPVAPWGQNTSVRVPADFGQSQPVTANSPGVLENDQPGTQQGNQNLGAISNGQGTPGVLNHGPRIGARPPLAPTELEYPESFHTPAGTPRHFPRASALVPGGTETALATPAPAHRAQTAEEMEDTGRRYGQPLSYRARRTMRRTQRGQTRNSQRSNHRTWSEDAESEDDDIPINYLNLYPNTELPVDFDCALYRYSILGLPDQFAENWLTAIANQVALRKDDPEHMYQVLGARKVETGSGKFVKSGLLVRFYTDVEVVPRPDEVNPEDYARRNLELEGALRHAVREYGLQDYAILKKFFYSGSLYIDILFGPKRKPSHKGAEKYTIPIPTFTVTGPTGAVSDDKRFQRYESEAVGRKQYYNSDSLTHWSPAQKYDNFQGHVIRTNNTLVTAALTEAYQDDVKRRIQQNLDNAFDYYMTLFEKNYQAAIGYNIPNRKNAAYAEYVALEYDTGLFIPDAIRTYLTKVKARIGRCKECEIVEFCNALAQIGAGSPLFDMELNKITSYNLLFNEFPVTEFSKQDNLQLLFDFLERVSAAANIWRAKLQIAPEYLKRMARNNSIVHNGKIAGLAEKRKDLLQEIFVKHSPGHCACCFLAGRDYHHRPEQCEYRTFELTSASSSQTLKRNDTRKRNNPTRPGWNTRTRRTSNQTPQSGDRRGRPGKGGNNLNALNDYPQEPPDNLNAFNNKGGARANSRDKGGAARNTFNNRNNNNSNFNRTGSANSGKGGQQPRSSGSFGSGKGGFSGGSNQNRGPGGQARKRLTPEECCTSKRHSSDNHSVAENTRFRYRKAKGIARDKLPWGPCQVPGCQQNNCPIVADGDPQWPVGCLCPQYYSNKEKGPYDPNAHPDFGKGCRAKKDTLRTTYNNRSGRTAALEEAGQADHDDEEDDTDYSHFDHAHSDDDDDFGGDDF